MAIRIPTGSKFNKLTILKRDDSKPKGQRIQAYYICECECGNLCSVDSYSLRHGNIQSCGCSRKDLAKSKIGKTFHQLTILDITTGTQCDEIYYKCECICGNIKNIRAYAVNTGRTRSCGCLAKETTAKLARKYDTEPVYNKVITMYSINATRRGLEWKLSHLECIQLMKGTCYYCGEIASNTSKTSSQTIQYNGIDRIDNTKGYTLDNTVSCCKICNRAKSNMDYSEFMSWIQKIKKYVNTNL